LSAGGRWGTGSTWRWTWWPSTWSDSSSGAGTDVAFARVEDAIEAIGRGELVVVVDDEQRENEGDLIMAAEAATPEKIAFFLTHTSGVICVPMTGDRLDELDLPLMVPVNTDSNRTAFTVSVDAQHCTSTGMSDFYRSTT